MRFLLPRLVVVLPFLLTALLLPMVLELCGRTVLMDDGRIIAADTASNLLRDGELLRAHRLELPYGIAPG